MICWISTRKQPVAAGPEGLGKAPGRFVITLAEMIESSLVTFQVARYDHLWFYRQMIGVQSHESAKNGRQVNSIFFRLEADSV